MFVNSKEVYLDEEYFFGNVQKYLFQEKYKFLVKEIQFEMLILN